MTAYKPLDSEETNELIKRSKNGDSEATDVLVHGNFPLIKRHASTEKRVVFGDASSAKKIFCAP